MYNAGDYNVICDVCGFKIKRSKALKRWDGAIVCKDDWEPRHPQDKIKAIKEKQTVKDARPEPEYRFLSANEIKPSDL